jgi:hypothetical protein
VKDGGEGLFTGMHDVVVAMWKNCFVRSMTVALLKGS